ncbi:MAG TPA: S8 family peptidase [Acidobacteriota bacterium]|jgi:serine protease AprX
MKSSKVLPWKSSWLGGLVLLLLFLPLFGQSSDLDQYSSKISPVLKRLVASQLADPKHDNPIPVIVQFQKGTSDKDKNKPPKAKNVGLVNGYAYWHNANEIRALLKNPIVKYITFDAATRPHQTSTSTVTSAVRNVSLATIGADQANSAGYTGQGVTVAVFDSGINPHPDLSGRVVAAVDCTSGTPTLVPSNHDGYGHGTHVAGVVAGSGTMSGGAYAGVAPQAQLVDVKVIGDDGSGRTSDLINAIDWAIQNKSTYNIRVANLSLGHVPVDTYLNDPSCQAVERMIQAGIVVVAASGNMGKTSTYPKIFGAIDSPGNDPSVITVYPINTRGTVSHSDDIATTYGSRGVTYIDKVFKPDISAPGNKIVSLLSPGCLISQLNPALVVDNNYMTMSGSSMATPFVAGTVALMIQANPSMTPAMVKMLLNLTATKLDQPNILEQGNGMLNTLTAVQMARVADMPGKGLGRVSPKWILDGEEVWVGGAVAFNGKIAYTKLVNQAVSRIWGNGTHWANALITDNSVIWSDNFLSPSSLIWGDGVIWADGIIWSDELGAFVWDGIIWTDTTLTTADSVIFSDSIIFSDSVIWSDDLIGIDPTAVDPTTVNAIIWTDSILRGDPN